MVTTAFQGARRRHPGEKIFLSRHWEDQGECVAGMQECARELIEDAAAIGANLDYFVMALGNGSSARGLGTVLNAKGITLIGMEPAESPSIAEYMNWEQRFGTPRPLESRSHGLIGTGGYSKEDIFVNMHWVIEQGLLSDIQHPTTAECREMQRQLMDRCGQYVGMTSAGCVVATVKYIEAFNLRNKAIGMLFYDQAWKYLDVDAGKE